MIYATTILTFTGSTESKKLCRNPGVHRQLALNLRIRTGIEQALVVPRHSPRRKKIDVFKHKKRDDELRRIRWRRCQ